MHIGRRLFAFLIVGLSFYICSPLLLPVAMGAVFAVLFFPVLVVLEKRRLTTGRASGLIILGFTLVVLLPTVILILLGVRAGLGQLHTLRETPLSTGGETFFQTLMATPGMRSIVAKIAELYPVQAAELATAVQDLARGAALKIADWLGGFLAHLPSIATGLVILVISTYFFLRDARRIMSFIRLKSVFNPHQTEQLIHSFASTCRSVILATVVSGFVQAVVFSAACLLSGSANAALVSILVFLASFIPLIGSAPVTFAVVIQQFISGRQTAGLALLAVAIVVALVDNVVRPLVLKGSGNLHPLIAFIAVFGGLQTLGFAGVFLGPIVVALGVATLNHLVLNHGRQDIA